MTRKLIAIVLGGALGVIATALVLAVALNDGGTAEAQAPPPSYTKVSMPDFGQHSTGWCWVAAAANSFWWYAENVARYEGLLGGAAKPWKNIDPNSQTPGSPCQGGATSWENIVCSCIGCNTRKANRTPQEAGMRLIRKPKRPKWRPFLQITVGMPYHESWKHFIDLAYWNVELGESL